jgi:hypothetical protein
MESVILGESAYQVQQGFLADANALRRAAAASQAASAKPGAAPPPAAGQNPTGAKQGEKKGDEQDMLEQFLLDNL